MVVPSPVGAGQTRLDWAEIGEPLAASNWESDLWECGGEIREYRFRFNQKRRVLIRDSLIEIIDKFDADLRSVRQKIGNLDPGTKS